MSNKLTKEPGEMLQFPMPRREEPPAYYTDAVNIVTTPFSCILTCSRTVGAAPDGRPVQKPEVQLYMSPTHMKALHTAIAGQIAAFETQHGPILVPQPRQPIEPAAE